MRSFCTINAQVAVAANCSEVLFRRRKRWVERHRVAFVGAMDRRRHNDNQEWSGNLVPAPKSQEIPKRQRQTMPRSLARPSK
jgi:hypothetical protein